MADEGEDQRPTQADLETAKWRGEISTEIRLTNKQISEDAHHNREFRKEMYQTVTTQEIEIALLKEWKSNQTRHAGLVGLGGGLTGTAGVLAALKAIQVWFGG